LLQRAREEGESSYSGADYDLALACHLLARVFERTSAFKQALPLLEEAQKRFENFERNDPGRGAARMASVCLSERGDCLKALGQLDQAATAYEVSICGFEKASDARSVAVAKAQLGTVRNLQRRHPDALQAFSEARDLFTSLDDLHSVATSWHQTGNAYYLAGQPEAAENAYRKSLEMTVRLGNVAL
jgi:tetratricopeptide (TPR) repeat protein